MNVHLSTEKKLDLLHKKLDEDLQIERALKRQINQEFEELKHLEVSLEKTFRTETFGNATKRQTLKSIFN
jgi:inorganic pyrophosphatase